MKTIKGTWLHLLQLIILILLTTAGSAQLHVGFTASPLSSCPPMVVTFKDTSTGKPTSWKWDLGNGTLSTEQNPIATYFNPGKYLVKLLVTNASGKDSVAKSDYIVVNALPASYFRASDSTGCFPLKVQFKDSSFAGSGTIEKWQWDFGDGTLSTDQNPSHTYTSPGIFTVILKIVNSNGCSVVTTKTAYIKINDGVKAAFSFSSAPGCETPATINFTNESTGTGTIKYQWDLGNGANSSATNPSNVYNGGIYTVKLIASNSFGCSDTITKVNAISVGTIHAGFNSNDSVCAGNNLALSNTSTPTNFTGVRWDFGDGGTSTQTNPGRIYANPGVYTLKLVAYFGACTDSISKKITVLAAPTAAFSAANTSGCGGPLVVTFQDQSIDAVKYNWSFGDGTTSTDKNPIHSYQNPGTYSVRLIITNSVGCTATMLKDNLVRFVPLKIEAINNLGVRNCVPLTVHPTVTTRENVPVGTYTWDFGDGTVLTGATPTHTYTLAGIYDVKLIVSSPGGCADTSIYKEAVKAGNKPVTAFSADPRDVCAILPVKFYDKSTGDKVDEWLWFFGDGGSSMSQNPIYNYNDTGHFAVTLITSSLGCSDTLKVERYINVRPPIAKFDTTYVCSEPLKRIFVDKSIGAETWDWDFGDGAGSKIQHPTHTYATPGVYNVLLTVSNGQCQHTTAREVVVVDEHGTFAIGESVTCLNVPVSFKVDNVKQANIASYSWYFNGLNENAVINAENPFNWAFSEPGERHPLVILTDILHCTDTLSGIVPVITYGPKASFESQNPNTCFGNTIRFTDASTTDGIHQIKEYVWDFGEGATQSYVTGPFSHDYSNLGTYNVKMVVTDSYGCRDSISRPAFVSVTKPVAKFTASDTALCPSLPITFTNTSYGVNANAQWNFGDGTTSTMFSPVHAFANPGTYKVKLVMLDVNGCSATDSTVINIYQAKADFAMSDSFKTCPDLVVNITNKSSNYLELNWDFGDGGNSQLTNPSHIYTYPGSYTVKLSVKNNGGCIDELTKKVVIKGPTGAFDYVPREVCNPGNVKYSVTSQNNIVRYIWDFNDGNTIFSTLPTVSHTYQNSGTYLPKIIMEDAGGCQVAVQGLDTVKVYSVNTHILSDAKMVCDSGIVVFKDSSTSNDVLKSFLWNFGDGTTSTLRNPTHNFSDTGYYSIKLVATSNFGCQDSAVLQNYVKVVNSPSITILGNTAACEPAKFQLSGGFLRKDTSAITWAWDFGNGKASDRQSPDSLSYNLAGTFPVTLKATNSDGCFNIVSKSVVVHPVPVVDAGPNAGICRFTPYTLTASGASSYTWRSHPSLSCTNCATPVIHPDSLVTYYVTGKSDFGCSSQDSVTIKVQQPFQMAVSQSDTLCKGEFVTLHVSGADKYQWTPSLWLSNVSGAAPVAKPDTSITYQVIGSDRNGCFADTANVRIKVFPLPTIDILNGDNIAVQVGGSIKLNTKSSPDVVNWKWFPAQWLSCATCSEPLAAPKDHVTYSVTATNEGNCSATDKVTVNLICNNANVFLPNTFSPNNDGVNDIFYPRGTGLFNVLSFKVFNRWGQIVFQKNGGSANNPLDGWDGNLNGLPLQPDVYVYLLEVVCANNIIFPLKGNVSLIR